MASSSNVQYDANGNTAQRDDFNQHRFCYAYDLTRNVETVRVEGLNTVAACGTYTAPTAPLPTGTRKTSTQWHPDWRLAAKVAEPGRITTSVYNGQPDPFNGNATASCAPSSAVLPDGKPIAVLCKQVEQATTDADGHLGFSAALQSGVANRVWSYTYNQYGQKLTETDPRGKTTTYAYYADTTASHTMGDLQSVTNALNQVTQYTQYNPHGQVLQSVDPTGVATNYSYDLRQRLTSVSVAGQTTTYEYWPTGLLKKATQPDGSWVAYGYDDAHRLTDVSDNLGNSVHYSLDNAGNRTKEETKDPSGVLALQLSRVMDALSRVQQTTGRE
jgi:YD repeat-containing protein